jgi:uracil-DNA glycosylase
MRIVTLPEPDDFDAWRDAARGLAAEAVPPEDVVWQVGDVAQDLFAGKAVAREAPAASPGFSVPRAFLDLARDVVLSAKAERFALPDTTLDHYRRAE